MQSDNSGANCTLSSFFMAALIGILATVVLRFFAELSWPGSIFIGLIALVVFGLIFNLIFCRELTALSDVQTPGSNAKTAPASVSKGSSASAKTVPTGYLGGAIPGATAVGGSSTPAVAEAPAPKGTLPTGYLGGAIPGATKVAAKKAAPSSPASPAAAPVSAAAPANTDFDGDGKSEGTDEGTRPAALDGPREGGADNLKEIKGIGPKLEKLCNSLGFYHFDQIANWTSDEIAWVDANLEGFRGRVTRDQWVAQAKILAAGGETEFSQRVEDGKVY
ncbi:MAG: NADH:ubiquinone oxidoreductase [Pseudomonadota bacterium]